MAKYHLFYVIFYEEFFNQEKGHSFAEDRILELVDDGWLHNVPYLNLYIINENHTCLITALKNLE